MNLYNSFLLFLSAASAAALPSETHVIAGNVPKDAGSPVLLPFVCFSIEFVFFPDFAGTLLSETGICLYLYVLSIWYRAP